MSGPRLIRCRDLVRVPWKNGGGTTAEVAASPPGAGFEAIDWRISLADVAADGPFSRFDGIDRTLVLVEGRGLDLTIDGERHPLAAPGAFKAFPGEAETAARLADGPIRDLNVMTRRGRWRHEVACLPPGSAVRSDRDVAASALVALASGVVVTAGGVGTSLDGFDVLIFDGPPTDLRFDGEALLILMWRMTPPS